jgi:membrane-associated phospholipid phosphatase
LLFFSFRFFCFDILLQSVVFELTLTFRSYKKLAIFTTNVDAENQTLINHKCVFGAMNRQFLVGAVTGCFAVCPKMCRVKFAQTLSDVIYIRIDDCPIIHALV